MQKLGNPLHQEAAERALWLTMRAITGKVTAATLADEAKGKELPELETSTAVKDDAAMNARRRTPPRRAKRVTRSASSSKRKGSDALPKNALQGREALVLWCRLCCLRDVHD